MNFFSRLEEHGTSAALIDDQGRVLTYTDLTTQADELAEKLNDPSLVFLVPTNSTESVIFYIACLRSGIPLALINEQSAAQSLEALIQSYQPSHICFPRDTEIPGNTNHVVTSIRESTIVETNCRRDYEMNPDLALLLSTSGSTGSPRFVRLSMNNVLSNAASIIESLGIRKEDRAITTLPMAYSYGLSIINTHLAAGASIVIGEFTVTQKPFWEILRNQEVTTFGGVPNTYEMLLRLRIGRMDLPSIRYLTQAGGRLNPETAQKYCDIATERGWRFNMMYGQTEATARMSCVPFELLQMDTNNIGYAIPKGEFTLVDESGNTIDQPDMQGELVYQGPNVCLGYATGCDDLTRGDDNQGKLHTGDLATRSEEGFFRIVGRKNRFLKLFGNRVNLDDVEQWVNSEIGECVCVGEDDRLQVYLTGTDWDTSDVKRKIAEFLHVHQSAIAVDTIEQIPRSDSGKIRYAELATRQ
ncbi:MAG: AMP-binding protein [Pseudomonadales bacterium]|nr:AMP-binding protein [Pseudomonadales bacterium]